MKKVTKILKSGICLALAAMMLAGCAKGTEPKKEAQNEAQNEVENKTRVFVDSAGREVEVPAEIKKVAPSGLLAQMVLYTACPDQLVGVADHFSEEASKYIDKAYTSLPKFGQFYGKNANLNMEAMLAEGPDVIIDIGEAKDTIKEDMDSLQEQIGIPVVFIEATISTMDTAYEQLGKLLGNEEEMKVLSEYCKKTIDHAEEMTKNLADEDKVSVYMALGEEGLNTNANGSFHAQVLDLIGAKNIADVEVTGAGAGSQVSLEQILEWNPEVILTYTKDVYEIVTTDGRWKDLDAVKNGRVYKIPTAPFNFISDPPSVNRMIGISWLGNLLYPDQYEFTNEEMKTFYKDFYHIELKEDMIEEIMEYAAAK